MPGRGNILKIQKIKNRGVLFTFDNSKEWDLNLYLIMGDKYNYIIDTGLGSLSISPILTYLKDNNKPVIVIITHYHWDHIWGNHSLKDSIIISHSLCRKMIEEKWDEMLSKNKSFCHGEVEKVLPNLIFENELFFPEDEIRIVYTPGHTIDSISIIDEKEKVINVGDNIGDSVDEIVPSLDCEMDLYKETLLKYRNMDIDTCISGHNVVLGKDIFDRIVDLLPEV